MNKSEYIHGDTFELIKLIQTHKFDVIHADIPYGTDVRGKGYSRVAERRIANDANLWWLPEVAWELWRILKDDKFCVIWGGWQTSDGVRAIFKSVGFTEQTVGVWDKGIQGMGDGFCNTYEQWMVFEKGNPKLNTKMAQNVIRYPRPNNPDHPHLKPKQVVKKILHNIAKKGDLVFDGFAGTGATAEACLELNLNYYCIELEREHVEKALTKIKRYHVEQQFEFKPREESLSN